MVEQMYSLQISQVKLKETYEHHKKIVNRDNMAYEESADCRSSITMPPATVTPFMPATIEEKVLRDNFIRGNDEHPKVPYHHFSNEIHVISLSSIDYADGWPRCVGKPTMTCLDCIGNAEA